MFRFLLALLAVLVPGLAFLFSRPWLYILTGAILAGSLGLLGWWLWTTYGTEGPGRPRPTSEPAEREPSLDELGIVDIQPESAEENPSNERSEPDEKADPEDTAPKQEATPSAQPAPSGPDLATQSPSANQGETSAPPSDSTDSEEPEDSREAPVLEPLLESIRAALEARTVCLLVQEDVALTYRIEAAASIHSSVRHEGTFDTQTPLLTATMSRESVTIRPLAEEKVAIEDLRYYDDPPAVDHLAVAPLSRPDTSSTTFLLADAPAETDLGSSRARTLLKNFADTVTLLLDAGRSPTQPEAEALNRQVNGQESRGHQGDPPDPLSKDGPAPRPRREIIAEEMEAAQSDSEDLTLALAHLNRAESIARRGNEAVASAERLFHARLEQMAPNQRIERFGELTYGIFFRADADTVEPWMADLESSMAQEEGELEGGVSVGAAVWTDEDPEGLRTAATEALREAYETGTCTIVT